MLWIILKPVCLAIKQPIFNGWLSVGVSKNNIFDIDSKHIPVIILSYYDKINNIIYSPSSNSILFDMPFRYDIIRLSAKDTNVYIHQEVYVPKPSILSSAGSYIGLVNGKDVTDNLVVDGSNKTKDVVHFMLPKPIVLQIVSTYNHISNNSSFSSSSSKMNFSLISAKNGSKSIGSSMNQTMMMMPSL